MRERLQVDVPCNGVGLFRGELCARHFSQLPPAAASACDAHESRAEAALHYVLLCEMERPFGTQALSALPFTLAHALCFFRLGSG